MITLRRSRERGHFNHGWLNTFHTFSFDQYYDPRFMNFRTLRVINEDFVAAGRGFPMHAHRDMEIITYILEGALQHEDSMGNGSIIRPGDVQRMSAGTGVRHSEKNPSSDEAVHLLQIWILPDTLDLEPGYEQKRFETADKQGRLRLIASRDGRDGAITVHQDVDLYAGVFAPGDRARLELRPDRHAWVQVARGTVTVNGQRLDQGDGAALSDEAALDLTADADAEVLVFDLA